jgi:hypothetical protein
MKTFELTTIVHGKTLGSIDVPATELDVAIKRFLGGGCAVGLKFATVDEAHRIRLQRGQEITIVARRVK